MSATENTKAPADAPGGAANGNAAECPSWMVPEQPGQAVLLLMAGAAGLFVASIYYNQPMLGILARDFGVGAGGVSSVAVLTQVGYALGLLLIGPLGDRFERRGFICLTALCLALTLFWAALAPSLGMLALASLGVGVFATATQLVVPMAAHLAHPLQRGQVVGTVMSGLLAGILLARTVSGAVSEYGNWRTMFGLAGCAVLVMAVLLRLRLPRVCPTTTMSYPRILFSLFSLLRQHRVLQLAGLVQGLLFAAFVAFWANLALFLERPPLSAGSTVAGLLGLVGAAGVLMAPLAGRMADKGGQGRVIAAGALAVCVSFVLFWLWKDSWVALIGGIVLMDVGLQASMVSNQSRVYALDAAARSRLNTVYMTIMFTAGALGTALGAQAFALLGWPGVCAMGAVCGGLAFGVEMTGRRRADYVV